MRVRSGALALILWAGAVQARAADVPKDVPANHWARPAVEAVLQRGAMAAPGGKFGGDMKVTRTDLIMAMASFGQSLEKGAWLGATGRRFKLPMKETSPAMSQGVTRYELAAVLVKMGSYAAAGVHKSEKRFGNSQALPKPSEVKEFKQFKTSDPVYPAMRYLAKNRMIWEGSVLGKPGREPVTGKEVAQSVAAVIAGAIDLTTDEPQNKLDLGPRPSEGRGKPSKAGGER